MKFHLLAVATPSFAAAGLAAAPEQTVSTREAPRSRAPRTFDPKKTLIKRQYFFCDDGSPDQCAEDSDCFSQQGCVDDAEHIGGQVACGELGGDSVCYVMSSPSVFDDLPLVDTKL